MGRSRADLRPCLAIALTLAAAAAGCAGEASPATTIERNETVEPGSFVELNLEMNASAELAYRWSTTPETTIAFDVHSHEGTDVRYHEQVEASQHEGSFTAPEDGGYSLLWENTASEPVTVEIHIQGALVLDSVAP